MALDNLTTLKFGVIGAGNIARMHLDVIKASRGMDVIGLTSRTPRRAKELAQDYGIQSVFNTLEELVKACQPDALLVLVSSDQMYQVGRCALDYGIPIFFEKPPALSLAETVDLVEIAKKNNVKTMVGFNRRYYSIFRNGLELIKEHGRLLGVAIEGHERFWKLSGSLSDIVRDRWIYVNNIHTIDLLRFFGGEIKHIQSVANSYIEKRGDQFVSAIEFETGTLGSFLSHWYSPGGWSVRLFGEGITAEFKPLEKGFWLDKNFVRHDFVSDDWDIEFKPGFYQQMQAFRRYIDGGSLEWPGQSLHQSLITMALSEEMSIKA